MDQETDNINRLDAVHVAGLLNQLPTEERDVVIARIWNGLTFQQIAESFSLSKATAHRLYESGLSQLRLKLKCDPVESQHQ